MENQKLTRRFDRKEALRQSAYLATGILLSLTIAVAFSQGVQKLVIFLTRTFVW